MTTPTIYDERLRIMRHLSLHLREVQLRLRRITRNAWVTRLPLQGAGSREGHATTPTILSTKTLGYETPQPPVKPPVSLPPQFGGPGSFSEGINTPVGPKPTPTYYDEDLGYEFGGLGGPFKPPSKPTVPTGGPLGVPPAAPIRKYGEPSDFDDLSGEAGFGVPPAAPPRGPATTPTIFDERLGYETPLPAPPRGPATTPVYYDDTLGYETPQPPVKPPVSLPPQFGGPGSFSEGINTPVGPKPTPTFYDDDLGYEFGLPSMGRRRRRGMGR